MCCSTSARYRWASFCLCELSCSRMWTNSKLVSACNFELCRLSLLKLFCLVACCFILSKFIMNWLHYTFTMCVDYTCLLHLVTIHLSCPKYLFTNLGDVTTVASFLSDPIKIDISVKLEKLTLWSVWDNCADQRRHWLQWWSIPQACLPWAPLTNLVPSFWTYQVTYLRTVKT